jgi:excisionase family DNA binding protein
VSAPAELSVVPPATGELLTPDDVAKRLKLSRSFVYGEIKRGRLKAMYFGRMPRIAESDFTAYLAAAAR